MTGISGNQIGPHLKEERSKAGISLSELAQQAKMSKSYLWNLENSADAQHPSAETVYALAKALNTTMSKLIGKKLLTDPTETVDEVLQRFAAQEGLSDGELRTLASIKWRGEPPRTPERWKFIRDALRASKTFDDE